MSITYDEIENKVKQQILVDNNGGTKTLFIRSYVYDDCGDLESTTDTDLNGTAYIVTGTVEQASQKIDFVDELKLNDRLKIDVVGSLNMATTNACVYLNQTTDQSAISSTGTVLELQNVSINTSPTTIDVTTTPGEYIFLVNGNYELELQLTADTDDFARRTSKTTLEFFDGTNWVDAVQSPSAFGYHRNRASGEDTVYNRAIVSASVNSRYRYKIESLAGLVKTVAIGTSLVIKQI